MLLASEGLSERRDRRAGRGIAADGESCGGLAMSSVGVDGLVDEDRPGRPKTVDQRKIVAETLTRRRRRLGGYALVVAAAGRGG